MGEMEMNDCWSLLAVVKECTRKAKLRALEADGGGAESTTTAAAEPAGVENDYHPQDSVSSQIESNNDNNSFGSVPAADELRDLYTPFMVPLVISPGADAGHETSDVTHMTNKMFLLQKPNQFLQPPSQELLQRRTFEKKLGSCPVGHCINRKKRFEEKRVCRLTLKEMSSNDNWAWRKYGQKPIKGSPYPRNYYRCSSTKGCAARKQVERCPINPETYVVTYTGRHYHPCPPVRNTGGPRAKFGGSDPDHPVELESPTNTIGSQMGTAQTGSGSGSGSGSRGDVVTIDDDDEHDDSDGGGGGGGDEEGNNYGTLNLNAMAGTDMLMGMEQLEGRAGKSTTFGTPTSNVQEHGIYGSNPDVNVGIQMTNGYGFGLGIREMDASSAATFAAAHETPSSWGLNIWDNGMIRPQTSLF